MDIIQAQQVASDYRAAFRAVNGRDIECLYEHGWFTLRQSGSAIGTKHRRKEIVDFTARLRARKQEGDESR